MEQTESKPKKKHTGLKIFIGLIIVGIVIAFYTYQTNENFRNQINGATKKEETITEFYLYSEGANSHCIKDKTIIFTLGDKNISITATVNYEYIKLYLMFLNSGNSVITTKIADYENVSKNYKYNYDILKNLSLSEMFTATRYKISKIICKKA